MQVTHALLAGARAPLPVTQAPLPGIESALIGLAALAVMLVPFLWPLVEHFNAMSHEGAHAIVGSLMGFTVTGITLSRKNEGLTKHNGPRGGPRRILTSFVGYLGPSGFGLAAAKLISIGQAITVLWLAVAALMLLLLMIRMSFAIVSVPVAILLLALIIHYEHVWAEVLAAYAMAWLLLLSGVRVAVQHGTGAGDAKNLKEVTHLPLRLWAVLWLAGTVAALLLGGKFLVLGR